MKFPPYSSRTPHPVSRACVHSSDSGASVSGNGCPANPPAAASTRAAAQATPTDSTAAATSASSNQQSRPPPPPPPVSAPHATSARRCHAADHDQRQHRGQHRHPVRELDHRQQQAQRRRHPPAARAEIEQQPADQQRHLRPDMIRRKQQHERPVPELRRQHDRPRKRSPENPFAPTPAPPRKRDNGQHEHRVRRRRGDVDHPKPERADRLDQHVLGQLGRVERHVAERPPVQQPVPCQHVARLQRQRGAVRGGRDRPRHPQVAEEEQHCACPARRRALEAAACSLVAQSLVPRSFAPQSAGSGARFGSRDCPPSLCLTRPTRGNSVPRHHSYPP